MNPIDFHGRVMAYCGKLGGSVTGGGRTEKRNDEVGGHPHSKHLVWLAADVVYDTTQSVEVRKKTATQLGIKVIFEGNHDHLQAY